MIVEYQQICDRLAREALRYAAANAADEEVSSKDVTCPKCTQPAGTVCVFTVSGQEAPEGFVHNERAVAALEAQCEHWIDVFLDEHLPDIDPETLLAVTAHADAFEKSAGRPAPSCEIAALHAFQADVWDAIHRMEETAIPAAEETAAPAEEATVARGMLHRYRSAEVAMEMAHWHAMDHAEGSARRARWLRVREMIGRLSVEKISRKGARP